VTTRKKLPTTQVKDKVQTTKLATTTPPYRVVLLIYKTTWLKPI